MLEDADNIRATAEDLTPETLRAVVDWIAAARRVYVFGSRGWWTGWRRSWRSASG